MSNKEQIDWDWLRASLLVRGYRDPDQYSEACLWAWMRFCAGATAGAACWAALREIARRRPAVNGRDYVRWGAADCRRGAGHYVVGGEVVSYSRLNPGELYQTEESREIEPWATVAWEEALSDRKGGD